jgi:hypothetical protein
VTNYIQFKKDMTRLVTTTEGAVRNGGAVRNIRRRLVDVVSFITKWVTLVHQKITGWESWSGQVSSFSFRADSTMLRNMGAGWAREYDGSGKSWFKIMKLLGVEYD